MKLIRGLQNLQPPVQGSVVTIGNFDGVHKGHQQLLQKLHQVASQKKLPAVLITMEPHPQEYFAREVLPARLTRLREKLLVFRQYDLQKVLCLQFNAKLAALSAEEFTQRVLVDGLAVKHLVIGDDFRFGRDRQGDYQLLVQLGKQYGFTVDAVGPVLWQNERVSSTRIRHLLKMGEMSQATQLLGRHYRLCGRVVYGDARGRQLGFPTANILLHRECSPLTGVFAVRIHGLSKKPLFGAANIGCRPTVDGLRTLLEVYILDFDADIYGRFIEVEFLHKLRDEKRFDSLDLLKQQIAEDVAAVREFI